MPICFNVSVYQTDPTQQGQKFLSIPVLWIQLSHKNIDASFVEEVVVENLLSSSVTHKDVEAIQALKYTDYAYTSVKDNTYDDFSSTVPDVPLDSESSKEIETEKYCPSIRQNAENDLTSTKGLPDVPLDSESRMESLTKELCPAKTIVKETNKSDIKEKDIQTIRVNPNVVLTVSQKRMKKKLTDYRIQV